MISFDKRGSAKTMLADSFKSYMKQNDYVISENKYCIMAQKVNSVVFADFCVDGPYKVCNFWALSISYKIAPFCLSCVRDLRNFVHLHDPE